MSTTEPATVSLARTSRRATTYWLLFLFALLYFLAVVQHLWTSQPLASTKHKLAYDLSSIGEAPAGVVTARPHAVVDQLLQSRAFIDTVLVDVDNRVFFCAPLGAGFAELLSFLMARYVKRIGFNLKQWTFNVSDLPLAADAHVDGRDHSDVGNGLRLQQPVRLRAMSDTEQRNVLSSFRSVVAVRDPLSRLVVLHSVLSKFCEQYWESHGVCTDVWMLTLSAGEKEKVKRIRRDFPSLSALLTSLEFAEAFEWPSLYAATSETCMTDTLVYDFVVQWQTRDTDMFDLVQLFQLDWPKYRQRSVLKHALPFEHARLLPAERRQCRREGRGRACELRLRQRRLQRGNLTDNLVDGDADCQMLVRNTYGVDAHLIQQVLKRYARDAHLSGSLPAWLAGAGRNHSYEHFHPDHVPSLNDSNTDWRADNLVYSMPYEMVGPPRVPCFAQDTLAPDKSIAFFASPGPKQMPICGVVPVCKRDRPDALLDRVELAGDLYAGVFNILEAPELDLRTQPPHYKKWFDGEDVRLMSKVLSGLLNTPVNATKTEAPLRASIAVCGGKHRFLLKSAALTTDVPRGHSRIWVDGLWDNRPVYVDLMVRDLDNFDFCIVERNFTQPQRVLFLVTASGQFEWVECFLRNMEYLNEAFSNTTVSVGVLFVYEFVLPVELYNFMSLVDGLRARRPAMARMFIEVLSLRRPKKGFLKAAAFHMGATSHFAKPNDILVLCDLHLDIPINFVVSTVKHTVQGFSTTMPIVVRLRKDVPLKQWANRSVTRFEDSGVGVVSLYASDYTYTGGYRAIEHFAKESWGGEDWAFVRQLFSGGLRIHRVTPSHYVHYWHARLGAFYSAVRRGDNIW